MLEKDATAIKNPNILFIFSGQGTQYPWMGVNLYKEEPVFRATLDNCSSLVRGWDPNLNIVKELHKGKEESRVYSARLALVLIPALQMALVQLLRSKGVRPAGNARTVLSVGCQLNACATHVDVAFDKVFWWHHNVCHGG